MENTVVLKCFHCGKEKEVQTNENIDFDYKLADVAEAEGMTAYIDLYRGRVLVFCNDNCVEAHKTKKGTIRVRPGYIV